MDGSLTATVCTVATSRRCEAPDDGPHSRLAHAGGRWWRWLPVGMWVLSARVTPWPRAAVPTLLELAAERADRAPHPVATMPAGAR